MWTWSPQKLSFMGSETNWKNKLPYNLKIGIDMSTMEATSEAKSGKIKKGLEIHTRQ